MNRLILLAYIDPGSGAMLLQMLLAGIVGVALFFRNAVAACFRKLFSRKNTPPPAKKDEPRPGDDR